MLNADEVGRGFGTVRKDTLLAQQAITWIWHVLSRELRFLSRVLGQAL